MRRRRSKTRQPGVSLFPFLAVLICTLGVLIVILVIAVQSASVKKSQQLAVVDAEIAQKEADDRERLAKKKRQREIIEALEDEIEVHDLQSEGFEDDRPRLREEVAKARDYRAHLEKELIELEEQAEQLVAEINLLGSDLGSIQTTVDEGELETLKQKIILAETKLAEKRQNVVTIVEKKYAIVPYRGAGGTKRIPVFVECTRNGLVLQPWNIPLANTDFFHPVGAGNPVDAALMAVRNYYQKYELADSEQRPYPLLVVRPDGAQSYGLARRSLISWDDEFGYELVTNDKELDFGTVDPQLQKAVIDAVEQSKTNQLALKRRRSALANARRNGSAGGQRGGFSDGRRATAGGGLRATANGGFVREAGGSSTSEQNRQVAWQENQTEKGRGDESAASDQTTNGQTSGQSNGQANNARIASSFDGGGGENSNAAFASAQQSSGPSSMGSSQAQESLAASRGGNWALPTETEGATGYVRPVSVTCGPGSFRIRNVAGETVNIPMVDDDSIAIDEMVSIIWQRIDAWGIAGANAYWKPSLAVTVQPGARHRFQMVKQLLKGSGLTVEEVGQ